MNEIYIVVWEDEEFDGTATPFRPGTKLEKVVDWVESQFARHFGNSRKLERRQDLEVVGYERCFTYGNFGFIAVVKKEML